MSRWSKADMHLFENSGQRQSSCKREFSVFYHFYLGVAADFNLPPVFPMLAHGQNTWYVRCDRCSRQFVDPEPTLVVGLLPCDVSLNLFGVTIG
jgi:hypothetical protein